MSLEENYNQETQTPSVGLIGEPGAGITVALAQAIAKHVYDATAEQRVFIAVEEEDGSIAEYVQVYAPFNDSLPEYDRLRRVNVSGEGKEQEIETASEVADNYFFELNCVAVEDIEGELPENWKDEIELDERQAGIRRVLAVKVLKYSDAPQVTKKRTFGQPKTASKNRIRLLSTFNGKEVETVIIFANKLPSDISAYGRLREKIGLSEGQGFDDAKLKIPAQMAAKAEIAENLGRTVAKEASYKGYTSEGYRDGVVPIHHLALALTAYMSRTIKNNQKK